MPSKFKDSGGDELVFAGAIVASGAPTAADLKAVTYDASDNSVIIPFDIKAADTECGLHIYAFPSGTTATGADPSIALLHGTKTITIPGGATSLNIEDAISLEPVSGATATGSVSLAVTIPADCGLTCDSSGFSYDTGKITATSIASGAHTVNFTLTKGGQTVYAWTETIYVYPGMVTDAWNTGSDGTTERVISAAQMYSTFYVRGSGGSWITGITSEAGNDIYGDGSLAKPYATVQKAVDKVKAINDGNTEYTIYVDGTVTGVTDISDTGTLKLLVIGLGTGSDIATLDGNSAGSVVKLEGENLNFTFENLKFTGGNATSGGGIYVASGNVKLNDCIVNGNTATGTGGGICTFGKLEISGGTISGNTAGTNGGGIYIAGSGNPNSSLTIDGCTIGGDTSTEANHAKNGGGIYKGSGGELNIKGNTIIKGNTATTNGGGIYNSGGTKISGGEISGNTADTNGGGIYTSGALNVSGSIEIAQNNNVFIRSGAIITVDGELTKPVAAYISMAAAKYTPGTQVLQADGTNVTELTDDICKKFILLDKNDPTKICEDYEIALNSAETTQGIIATKSAKLDKVYLNSGSTEATEDGTEEAPAKTLAKALTLLNTNATTPTIIIQKAYSFGTDTDDTLDFSSYSKTVTIQRYYNATTASNNCTGDLITISSGTVNINNVIIDGNWKANGGTEQITNATGPLLKITGGTVTIDGVNTKMQNNYNNSSSISYGGAIYCKGNLTIQNGTISGNQAKLGGGIYVEGGGNVTMTGGSIESNIARQNSNAAHGGGVYIGGSSITSPATFSMGGGKIDSNNTRGNGGGIYAYGANSASRAVVNISGGEISSNKAGVNNSNGGGGGICLNQYSTLVMNGGQINGNTVEATNKSTAYGNGIYMVDTDSNIFEISGEPQFGLFDIVYLYNSTNTPYITITGALTGTSPIATIQVKLPSAKPQVLKDNVGGTLVVTEYTKFAVTPNTYIIDSSGKIQTAP